MAKLTERIPKTGADLIGRAVVPLALCRGTFAFALLTAMASGADATYAALFGQPANFVAINPLADVAIPLTICIAIVLLQFLHPMRLSQVLGFGVAIMTLALLFNIQDALWKIPRLEPAPIRNAILFFASCGALASRDTVLKILGGLGLGLIFLVPIGVGLFFGVGLWGLVPFAISTVVYLAYAAILGSYYIALHDARKTSDGWPFASAVRPKPKNPLAMIAYVLGAPPVIYCGQGGTLVGTFASLVAAVPVAVIACLLAILPLMIVDTWNVRTSLEGASIGLPIHGFGGSWIDSEWLFNSARDSLTFYVILLMVMLPLAILISFLGRIFIRTSYRGIRRRDLRRPLLYLRAFKDDRTTLPRGELSSFLRIVFGGSIPGTLDEMFFLTGGAYGPPVAIGKPQERIKPFGSARLYIKGTDWQSQVRSLLSESQFICIVLDTTEGVRWEMQQIIETKLLEKTLIVFAPSLNDSEATTLAAQLTGTQPSTGPRIIGLLARAVSGEEQDEWIVFRAQEPTPTSFQAMLQECLIRTRGYPWECHALPKLADAPAASEDTRPFRGLRRWREARRIRQATS